ncbi:Lysosomal Cobalamin Transporter Abcd4 [Manis pentadactyla]|nr:Lysosomal Cobalamin Transporter Abcd4 [Manis pentadactyla]
MGSFFLPRSRLLPRGSLAGQVLCPAEEQGAAADSRTWRKMARWCPVLPASGIWHGEETAFSCRSGKENEDKEREKFEAVYLPSKPSF